MSITLRVPTSTSTATADIERGEEEGEGWVVCMKERVATLAAYRTYG